MLENTGATTDLGGWCRVWMLGKILLQISSHAVLNC